MKVQIFQLCVKEYLHQPTQNQGNSLSNPYIVVPVGLAMTYLESNNNEVWIEFVNNYSPSVFLWQMIFSSHNVSDKSSFIKSLQETTHNPTLVIQQEVIPYLGDENDIFDFKLYEVRQKWDKSIQRLHQIYSTN